MEIYSIGFTKTTAEHFFGRLRSNGVRRLLDVRRNTSSQLAGFAKDRDLPYFLRELVGAEYAHEPLLAPTDEILNAFKRRGAMTWEEYEERFTALLRQREVERRLDPATFLTPTALLCSEATPEHCHRRLVLEYLAEHWDGLQIAHL
ncbi:MAG TPA: DUF488 domain-containing protein [Solirubrobacteraceae bacterium]|jgi:uncharacterized protein (DUF488 family)|nr:DUF488 domain-containing protein [Solirubrobacteraceae bacterium]